MRKSENQEMRESDELPGEYDIPRQSPADMMDEALRLVQHWRGLYEKEKNQHEKLTNQFMEMIDENEMASFRMALKKSKNCITKLERKFLTVFERRYRLALKKTGETPSQRLQRILLSPVDKYSIPLERAAMRLWGDRP